MPFCCPKSSFKKDFVEALSYQIGEEKGTRFLARSDETVLNETLSDAFLDDPMFKWAANLSPSSDIEEERKKMLPLVRWLTGLATSTSFGYKYDGVFIGVEEGSSISGCESASPKMMVGAMNMVLSTGWEPNILDIIMYVIKHGSPIFQDKEGIYGPLAMKRLTALDVFSKKRFEITKDYPNHIYIKMVGTRRDWHGKGIGGTMFRPLFRAADALGIPMYLETETKENEAMYQHYGFETKDSCQVFAEGDTSPDAKFKMYFMLRMPQTTTKTSTIRRQKRQRQHEQRTDGAKTA